MSPDFIQSILQEVYDEAGGLSSFPTRYVEVYGGTKEKNIITVVVPHVWTRSFITDAPVMFSVWKSNDVDTPIE